LKDRTANLVAAPAAAERTAGPASAGTESPAAREPARPAKSRRPTTEPAGSTRSTVPAETVRKPIREIARTVGAEKTFGRPRRPDRRDRFGGRLVFTALLAFSSLAALVVPMTGSYGALLIAAFLIGVAGSSFAVGAAFVSRWTPAARQGTALGVYGLGTMGQSLAVFVGPVVAARLGWQVVFRGTSALLLAWAVAYFLLARNPPHSGRPAAVAAMMAVLRRAPAAWLLGAFYFLTFGGFVAFSIYLPTLLRAQFGLAPADAGMRAARGKYVMTMDADLQNDPRDIPQFVEALKQFDCVCGTRVEARSQGDNFIRVASSRIASICWPAHAINPR